MVFNSFILNIEQHIFILRNSWNFQCQDLIFQQTNLHFSLNHIFFVIIDINMIFLILHNYHFRSAFCQCLEPVCSCLWVSPPTILTHIHNLALRWAKQWLVSVLGWGACSWWTQWCSCVLFGSEQKFCLLKFQCLVPVCSWHHHLLPLLIPTTCLLSGYDNGGWVSAPVLGVCS